MPIFGRKKKGKIGDFNSLVKNSGWAQKRRRPLLFEDDRGAGIRSTPRQWSRVDVQRLVAQSVVDWQLPLLKE